MRCKRLWILAIAVLFIFCNKSKDPGRQHLILESFFEGTDPFARWANNQHCCDYSLIQSNAKVAEGANSLRLEVRSTDPQVSSSIRSELVQPAEGAGTERWYGFKMFLENWGNDDAGEHVFQWHPDDPGGSAIGALFTTGGRYEFVTTHYAGTSGNGYTDLGPIFQNQWVSWIIHVKWAADQTGIIQVWKNGTLVMDVTNKLNSPTIGSYFKLGINKFGWGFQPSTTSQRILYFDEVRIGDENAGYKDVKPDS